MNQPLFPGSGIHERLWPVDGVTEDGTTQVRTDDGTPVVGRLFVKPQDGTLVFRQTGEGEKHEDT